MNWLHTWTGVVLGAVLFAIFWMGTLSVFDREIDRWMMPATRIELPPNFSYEMLRPAYEAAKAAKSPSTLILAPNERQPVIIAYWLANKAISQHLFDPRTGAELPDQGTLAGTKFIYPFHYSLQLRFFSIGNWIVGLCGMAMMVLCVSGVIIHRKIFSDFFTFRPKRRFRRAVLDLHNLTGVIGLPFHFAISLSGLVIFYALYFPSGIWSVYRGDNQQFVKEAYDVFTRPKLKQPGELMPLNEIVDRASRSWSGGEPSYLYFFNLGDKNGYVQLNRAVGDTVLNPAAVAYLDTETGDLLLASQRDRPISRVQSFIAGMHYIQFSHWTLRWLYFVLGLAGCILIGTGLLFWLDTRRARHKQLGLRGVPIVDALAVGSTSGLVLATLAFLVANRMLPLNADFAGISRSSLEIWCFLGVWILSYANSISRPHRTWIDQCYAIAALAASAIILNWITTGDNLVRTVSVRHLWPVAGIDVALIGITTAALLAGSQLQKKLAKLRTDQSAVS